MKKFATMLLALLLTAALTVPAMATFTSAFWIQHATLARLCAD